MRPLVVDIGGSHVKAWSPEGDLVERLATGKKFSPARLIAAIRRWVQRVSCDRLSIGYPGQVCLGTPCRDPHNLSRGWIDFAFHAQIPLPIRIMNDSAMQALGSYHHGRMLYLGLGTSVGSSLVADGFVIPLELGSLPYSRGRCLEEVLSNRALNETGRRRWRKCLLHVLPKLQAAFAVDTVVVGGGNAPLVTGEIPPYVRLGDNRNAYLGGIRLWQAQVFQHVYWIPEDQRMSTAQAPPPVG